MTELLCKPALRTSGRYTNSAQKNRENTFFARQTIESGYIGTEVDNVAIYIRARTDLNQYARPGIYLDCYGSVGCLLYFDTDKVIKAKVGNDLYQINMTRL